MILNQQNADAGIVSSGVKNVSAFSMEMNGKAFRILSDQIYQDKIGSIVREISTNALDSHNQAGRKELPFEIHIPDSFEPYFSVKDYGVGLSHDEMTNIYTRLFCSTKDNNNDAVGAFGLGSKTPFCYTNGFTLISIKDGMRRAYDARFDDNGIPTLALLDETITDEANGLEVNIAVEDGDFSKFADAVKSQLAFFPVKPVITNRNDFKFDIMDIKGDRVFGNDDYSFYKATQSFRNNTFYIVQGGVGYPLNFDKLNLSYQQSSKFSYMANDGIIVMFFNIGEIEVTTSREAIAYTKTTVANILNKLEAIRAGIRAVIEQKATDIENEWDRAVYVNTLNTRLLESLELTFVDKLPSFTKEHDKYNLNINKIVPNSPFLFTHVQQIAKSDANGFVLDDKGNQVYTTKDVLIPGFNVSTFNSRYQYTENSGSITPTENLAIFYKNQCKGALSRIRNYNHENGGKEKVIVISRKESCPNNLDIKKASEFFGNMPIRLASSLPEVARQPSNTVRDADYLAPKFYVLIDALNAARGCWEKITGDFDDLIDEDTHYIRVGNYQSLDEVGKISNSPYHFKLFQELKSTFGRVVVISDKYFEKIEDHPKWKCLYSRLDEELTARAANNGWRKRRHALALAMASVKSNYTFVTKYGSDFTEVVDTDIQYIMKLKKLGDKVAKFYTTEEMYLFSCMDQVRTQRDKFHAQLSEKCKIRSDAFNAKYPLLSMLDSYKFTTRTEAHRQYAIDYITLMQQKINQTPVVESIDNSLETV